MRAEVTNAALLICLISLFGGGRVFADTLPGSVTELRRGVILVADRSLLDPNFSRSVVLLTYHAINGSIGLIVNRSSEVSIVSTLPELDGLEDPATKLRFGGPIGLRSVRLLVKSSREIPGAEHIRDDVYFVNSTLILRTLLAERDPGSAPEINYYAGYAGWASRQLDAEIARGDWHVTSGGEAEIFAQDGDTMWDELIEKLEGRWVLMENGVAATGGRTASVKAITNRPPADGLLLEAAYNR